MLFFLSLELSTPHPSIANKALGWLHSFPISSSFFSLCGRKQFCARMVEQILTTEKSVLFFTYTCSQVLPLLQAKRIVPRWQVMIAGRQNTKTFSSLDNVVIYFIDSRQKVRTSYSTIAQNIRVHVKFGPLIHFRKQRDFF